MFDAVQHPERVRARTVMTAAAVAIAFHAAVLAFMIVVGAAEPEEPSKEEDFTFVSFRPPPPPPPPAAPRAAAVQAPAKPRPKKRDVPVIARDPAPPPTPIEPAPAPEPVPEQVALDETAVGSAAGGVPGGVPGGVEGGLGDPAAYAGETVALSEEMEKPAFLSGEDPQWSRGALESGVGGMIVARCVLTQQGELTRCELLKRVEHMDEAVIRSLRTRRYRPAMLHGRPVSVHYVVKFRLVPPAR